MATYAENTVNILPLRGHGSSSIPISAASTSTSASRDIAAPRLSAKMQIHNSSSAQIKEDPDFIDDEFDPDLYYDEDEDEMQEDYELASSSNYQIKREVSDAMEGNFRYSSRNPTGGEGEFDIRVRSVMCNFQVPCHVDLRQVALSSVNVELELGRNLLVKQKRWPYCKAHIYNTGRVVIIGCSSVDNAKIAAKSIVLMIRHALNKPSLNIRKYEMPEALRAEGEEMSYEPELDTGLMWKMKSPKVALRVHHTGSLIATGARCLSEIEAAVNRAGRIVARFRLDSRYRAPKPYKPVYIPPLAAHNHHILRMNAPKRDHYSKFAAIEAEERRVEEAEKVARDRYKNGGHHNENPNKRKRSHESEGEQQFEPEPVPQAPPSKVLYVGAQDDSDESDSDDFEEVT